MCSFFSFKLGRKFFANHPQSRNLMGNMAEEEKEIREKIQIDDGVEDGYEEEEENGGLSQSKLPNTSFEAELNMLLVFLSLFPSSKNECMGSEESEQSVTDHPVAAKACISRLQAKKREIHEPKLMRRPSSSFQTSVRDSRHGRKM